MDIKLKLGACVFLVLRHAVLGGVAENRVDVFASLTNRLQYVVWHESRGGGRTGGISVYDLSDPEFQVELNRNFNLVCPDEYARALRSAGNHANPSVEALRKKANPCFMQTRAIKRFREYAQERLGEGYSFGGVVGCEKFRIVNGLVQGGLSLSWYAVAMDNKGPSGVSVSLGSSGCVMLPESITLCPDREVFDGDVNFFETPRVDVILIVANGSSRTFCIREDCHAGEFCELGFDLRLSDGKIVEVKKRKVPCCSGRKGKIEIPVDKRFVLPVSLDRRLWLDFPTTLDGEFKIRPRYVISNSARTNELVGVWQRAKIEAGRIRLMDDTRIEKNDIITDPWL